MRCSLIALTTVFIASTVLADEPTLIAPTNYSREALLRFVASNDIKMSPLPERPTHGRVQWHFGWMEFRALDTDWRIFYLPIMLPLPGSTLRDVAKVPNALELTGTPIASTELTVTPILSTTGPQLGPDRSAAVNREVKRVLKLERHAKINAER